MKILLFSFLIITTLRAQGQVRNPRNVQYNFKTDTTNRSVELNELMLVLPRKSFPIIDYPKFINKSEGLLSFFKHEPVIALEINGEAKAYPLNMLTAHEISNDSLGGIPILPTYCPLCNASAVFDRRVTHNGKTQVLEFEVSGMLRNSDMVMFDRETETWWQQLIGEAIVGQLNGAVLDIIPSVVISVEEFFKKYPKGKILSKKTGHTGSEEGYGTNPYINYDSKETPISKFIDLKLVSDRLPAMERVVDVFDNGKYRIYPFSAIGEKGVINDTFGSRDIVIFHKKGMVSVMDKEQISESKDVGSATMFLRVLDGTKYTFYKKGNFFVDDQTKSKWNITGECISGKLKGKQLDIEPHSNHFAFAWLAFHPDSEIYEEK